MSFLELKNTTLIHVPEQFKFFVCRGDRIDNIYDLVNCIEHLSPEQFHTHVNNEKNDFANWIRNVLQNGNLANDLSIDENIVDRQHYLKTIKDHVAWLESL